MCQLLGLNANTPTDIVFSVTGFASRADEHKDGFGIAFAPEEQLDFEGSGVALVAAGLWTLAAMAIGWTTATLLRLSPEDRFTFLIEFSARNIAVASIVALSGLGRVDLSFFSGVYMAVGYPMTAAAALWRRGARLGRLRGRSAHGSRGHARNTRGTGRGRRDEHDGLRLRRERAPRWALAPLAPGGRRRSPLPDGVPDRPAPAQRDLDRLLHRHADVRRRRRHSRD